MRSTYSTNQSRINTLPQIGAAARTETFIAVISELGRWQIFPLFFWPLAGRESAEVDYTRWFGAEKEPLSEGCL